MKLTPEEKAFIKNNEDNITSLLQVIDTVKKFKLNDYLIAYNESQWDPLLRERKLTVVINSYGAVKKFQVVHVDKHGIPYIKELNKKGKPSGQLISSIKNQRSGYYSPSLIFEVDPEYTDSIILDDESNFNAAENLKAKADNFKAIAEHNKKVKIDCNNLKDVMAFLSNVKVGDILWKSHATSMVVTEMNPFPKHPSGRLNTTVPFMKATKKGVEIEFTLDSFRGTALYSDRPRSYTELKDPK